MTVTKKQFDEVSPLADKLMSVVNVVARVTRPLLRVLYKFGPLRRAVAKSHGARVGAISGCSQRGEHDEAVALAIDALKAYRHQPAGKFIPSGSSSWWFLMHLAVRSLEECDDRDTWDELIEMARNGVEPFEGYSFAQSYLGFSLWKYRYGEHDAAVEFAEIAARADPTWGEPDFVLGWYCLAVGGGDPLAHLTKAIRKDRGILFRIARDPLCRQHPHIIQRLKELSAGEIVTGRDEMDTEEDGSAAD